ncbi:FAD-dependent oxidoreductase [Thalassotalea sp. HSM 43]|uniref:FAD-dependent oxidoreductase n=1 Tax=Thalassotalea sp. HSM 43 TaxID=2552945 RepID=UPI001080D57A|nr:FAD-dependent oxidoreductase [Thalassotalea sp. HSM 43]QBY03298.1 FAD-dependent oxidoreductase [Thalassotalea sp. HSM 43]
MHVIVIGAGVQGITTAYYLNQYGCEVTVIDSAASAAMECSFANGGGVTPSAVDPWNAPGIGKVMFKYLGRKDSPLLFRLKALPELTGWGLKFLKYANSKDFLYANKQTGKLANYSVQLFDEIRQDADINYHYSGQGTLKIFRDQQSLDEHLQLSEVLRDMGNADFQTLSQHQTVEIEPSLSAIKDKLSGALLFPGDEAGNSHIFCQQLSKVLARRGVEFCYNSLVTSIEKHQNLFELTISTQGKPLTIKADKVVVAAGAKTSPILAPMGINVPVKPAKGYSLSIDMIGWQNRPQHLIADMNLHAGINPLGDVLRVAGTAEFAGFDKSISDERINNLVGLVESVFPEFIATIDKTNLNPWTGLRPMSCDGMAILGQTKVDGLYINTGQGAQGWTTSPASGRLVADVICNRTPQLDIKPYSIARF